MPDNRLDTSIPAAMRKAHVPGLALAMVAGDRVIYHRVFGAQDAQAHVALTRDTLFQAASLSKPVFAYLVLKLVADGRLELDTPLAAYWRDETIDDPRVSLITARHALSHTTGFPNWRDGEHLQTEAPPGYRFGYSGEGYEYLQRVVEHITKRPLHDEIRREVLGPLGMRSSTFAWAVDEAGEFVLDRHGDIMSATERAASSAAFSLLTTAGDYARLVRAVLSPGTQREQPLSEREVRTMLTPQVRLGGSPSLRWALGWGIQRTEWGDALWHWGGAQNGYMNYVVGFPERRVGIVILTNGESGLEICEELTWIALGYRVAQPAFRWLLPFDAWTPAPH